ncbi:RecQ family ATP-dependent DNA helicase [Oceanobacillus bengalensis]|uniref:ATP-dependent DNA helicase RecQ n=1 Tax=Oceanobacillus bengalensis TaxID=1435466 RepID=A0A494Z155_9BACI|nr:RecQ family ATP-dependent DNA helicase [Oceanobacillus bengalensis]RKQ16118.1 ATP-dependent DNA helicase RecQ [Oceanobacillus bengalensis]
MKQVTSLEGELQKYFNYPSFRRGQKEIITDIIEGHDVLGVLPTGSGKSICYQLPALLLDGITIVVSPLISLMMDQVKQLKASHFKKVVALNSFINPQERKQIYKQLHLYKLIYISPELLQQQEILNILTNMKVSLFVVDEAHCISQWGPEFRPDYLKLGAIIESLHHPRTLALSATATPEVQEDIVSALKKTSMKKHIYPMDKPNIAFCIEKVAGDDEKVDRLVNYLSDYQVPALIYFSSRSMAEKCAKILSKKLTDRRIAFYHGGMEQIDRVQIQQQFMNDQLDVICCTSAFGMGINKSNIRLVIHYHLPLQMESFIQEVGRAGRDGKASVSLLLFSQQDIQIPSNMIKNELPSETDLTIVFQYLYRLGIEKVALPDNAVETQNLLQLSETQWRFLRYQFEKHGMIRKNKVIYHQENWSVIFQSIKHVIVQRNSFKENKLTEMINWVHEKECLRKKLYKNFQSSTSGASDQCCSNCGFVWAKWTPEKIKASENLGLSWEERLQQILLVE